MDSGRTGGFSVPKLFSLLFLSFNMHNSIQVLFAFIRRPIEKGEESQLEKEFISNKINPMHSPANPPGESRRIVMLYRSIRTVTLICLCGVLIVRITGGGTIEIGEISWKFHSTDNAAIVLAFLLTLQGILLLKYPRLRRFSCGMINSLLNIKRRHRIVWFAASGYFLFFTFVAVHEHMVFRTNGFDLGIFDNVLWNRIHTGRYFNSLEKTNQFAIHFFPILEPISLLYRFFPTPIMLLVLQTAALSLGAPALYKIGINITKNESAGLLIAVLYLFYQPVRNVNLFDFHPVALTTGGLLWAFAFLIRGMIKRYWICIILVLMCKEIAAPTVTFLGLFLVLKGLSRKAGFQTAILGGAVSLFLALVYFPLMNPEGSPHMHHYSHLGSGFGEIIINMIRKPAMVADTLLTVPKLHYLIKIFGPVLFLPFAAPASLLPAAPTLFQNLLSARPETFSIYFQYTATITPFVFISAFYGYARVTRFFEKTDMKRDRIRLTAGFALALSFLYFLDRPPIWLIRQYPMSSRIRTGHELHELVPPRVPVSAQSGLIPHLSGRRIIRQFPDIDKAEYIVLDLYSNTWPLTENEYLEKVAELTNDSRFKKIADVDGHLIFRKKQQDKRIRRDKKRSCLFVLRFIS